ncbi:MAG: hypothetical protein KDB70_14045 [Mycobacterium sp.]|jgi:hypothetical protein|nr:hypothetical protein [Mycobacterium sp.]
MNPETRVSRILLFTVPDHLEPTVSAVAAAAGAAPIWTDVLRRDGSVSPQAAISVGGARIEISGGAVASPAVSVPDPEAAAEAAAQVSGFEIRNGMAGVRVVAPDLVIALRQA